MSHAHQTKSAQVPNAAAPKAEPGRNPKADLRGKTFAEGEGMLSFGGLGGLLEGGMNMLGDVLGGKKGGAQTPGAGGPASGAERSGGGDKDAKSQEKTKPAEPPGDDAQAEGNAMAALEQAGAAGKNPKGAKAKVKSAYEDLRAWTMTRLPHKEDGQTRLGLAWIAKKWAAGGQKGDEQEFIRDNFFKAYWLSECRGFAQRIAQGRLGKGFPSLQDMIDETTAAADSKGMVAKKIPGRTTLGQGLTIGELSQSPELLAQIDIGTAIHVKMHYQIDAPYTPRYDFHHWVTYVGNGRFADSLIGSNGTGKSSDNALRSWVKRLFGTKNEHDTLAHLQTDPIFAKDPTNPKAGPTEHMAVPRISAMYDPSQAGGKKSDVGG